METLPNHVRLLCYTRPMHWDHKGITFDISFDSMGPLFLAAARVPAEGLFVRVRPFSAIGRSQDEAFDLLKQQIEIELRRVPEPPPELLGESEG